MSRLRSLAGGVMIVGIVLCAALLGATAASAHGGDSSRIHACVNKSSGRIRIVGPLDTCRAGERALDWNIRGPQGPPGPSFLQVVLRTTERQITVEPRDLFPFSTTCAPGEVVLAGGPSLFTASLPIRASGPFLTAGGVTGFTVFFENPTASPITETVGVSATCTAGSMRRA